jgi:tetratricopeptide (TPR) repeat protein
MANRKDPNGVLATIERLAVQAAGLDGLRVTLIKYLWEGELFEGGRKTPEKQQGKLERGRTDALVMNVLNLDEIFAGGTQTVRKIVLGEFSDADLTARLKSAADNLDRRRDAYDYWARRMDALRGLLVDDKPDLRTVRIDEALRSVPKNVESRCVSPFALHAVQQLERLEERGRLGAPSANELSEQADAYFALGDYVTAAEKATQAVEIDPNLSRAWFIRVMVLLRQRNAAASLMQRHQINAVEVAEPLSAHETMERDLADDAGSRAYNHQVSLNDVVPHALLNWPKRDDGSLLYEREEQLSLVRNLLVDAVFAKVAGWRGVLLDSVPEAIEVSSSPMRPCEYWRRDEQESGDAQVLTVFELGALELLFEERRRHAGRWTETDTSMDTARELKLLPLVSRSADSRTKSVKLFEDGIS